MNALAFATLIDTMRFRCRLREIEFFVPATTNERITRIACSLETIGTGRFVIGLGPNCSETIRVGRYPIRFGRHASPLEEPNDEPIDYTVGDASLHGPREVSRKHCTLDPTGCANNELAIIDEGSSTGTWLYPAIERITPHAKTVLMNGGIFSLGPSGTNLFLLVCL